MTDDRGDETGVLSLTAHVSKCQRLEGQKVIVGLGCGR